MQNSEFIKKPVVKIYDIDLRKTTPETIEFNKKLNLFNHMYENHNLILTNEELREIILIIQK